MAARQVLDEIYRSSEAAGVHVDAAGVELIGNNVTSGYVDLGSDTYFYQPGYTAMEDDDWFCSTEPVNTNWYVWDC